MQRPLEDAANGDAPKILRVVEIGDQDLQRAGFIAGGRRNRIHDGFEERLQVFTGFRKIEGRGPVFRCV